jgi:sugar phosphate isomerase/epimerase
MIYLPAMSAFTRREWNRLVLGGLAGGAVAGPLVRVHAALADSRIAGVRIGVQSYSFRDRPLDQAIAAMKDVGLTFCELWQDHVEPSRTSGTPRESRDALRQWRLTTPLEQFQSIRKKFDAAGIRLTAYNISFRDDFTDEEIARGFEMARALGVTVITASSNLTVVPRVDAAAQKYKIRVGFHNHSNKSPNEFSGPDDFEQALSGRSKWMAINLDIGHFVAAGHDPLPFLDQHHARIVSVHVKDRKLGDPVANLPFGQGDTPIVAVLQRLRDRHWDIPANIEYEYKGGDTVAEVRRCFEYCKNALMARR